MAKIRSILTGREIDVPDIGAGSSALGDLTSAMAMAVQLSKATDAAEKFALINDALIAANAERDRALADREALAIELSTARTQAAQAQGQATAERTLRIAAEQRAADAQAKYDQDRAAWEAEERKEVVVATTPAPTFNMAVMASMFDGVLRDRLAANNPATPPGSYDVVIAERDGNGDGKRFIVKKK